VGCPRARTQIVPPQDALDDQAINTENYVYNLERPGNCFRHTKCTFPNFDGGTSTGMMTSSMHLCVASLTCMLYKLI
jgi:hypothetical protein